MYADRFDLRGTNGLFDVTQRVECELVNLIELVRVLPVILDQVYVVGCGEEAGEGGGFAVPQRSRDDAY